MILIFVEGPCPKRVDSFRISAKRTPHTNIMDLLRELRMSGEYFPQSALSLYSASYTRLHKIIRSFRSFDKDTRLYFITPLGVFGENDPAVWYEECLSEMHAVDIKNILLKFGSLEKLYDLLEEQYRLSIICASSRLLKVLEIDYFIPANSPSIIVSDAYLSTRPNIYTITPKHHIANRIRKIYGKSSMYDLFQYCLDYIGRALNELKFGTPELDRLFDNPRSFFQTLFSRILLDKLLAQNRRQDRITRFLS